MRLISVDGAGADACTMNRLLKFFATFVDGKMELILGFRGDWKRRNIYIKHQVVGVVKMCVVQLYGTNGIGNRTTPARPFEVLFTASFLRNWNERNEWKKRKIS